MDSLPSRRRIGIAEGSSDLRQIVSAVFSAAGFDVDHTVDGMETLRLLYTNPPDLLVLDDNLPGVSGLDVLKHIREETLLRSLLHLKIIFITSNPTALTPSESRLADQVLLKPFDVFELLQLIRSMLSKSVASSGTAGTAR